MSTFYLRYFLS